MGSPPSTRKRRYFGPGDGKKRYILTEEGDIYTLDSRAKLAILEALPQRGAFRWVRLLHEVRGKGIKVAENRLCSHVREMVSAGLIGLLTPENRHRADLRRDKLYRTSLKYEVINTDEVKRLLGQKTKSWRWQTKHGREPSQARLTDVQFNFFNYFRNLVPPKPFYLHTN